MPCRGRDHPGHGAGGAQLVVRVEPSITASAAVLCGRDPGAIARCVARRAAQTRQRPPCATRGRAARSRTWPGSIDGWTLKLKLSTSPTSWYALADQPPGYAAGVGVDLDAAVGLHPAHQVADLAEGWPTVERGHCRVSAPEADAPAVPADQEAPHGVAGDAKPRARSPEPAGVFPPSSNRWQGGHLVSRSVRHRRFGFHSPRQQALKANGRQRSCPGYWLSFEQPSWPPPTRRSPDGTIMFLYLLADKEIPPDQRH